MMRTTKPEHERARREQGGETSRRSLLSLVTAGIGALLSLPAQAHQHDPVLGAEPVATPHHSNEAAESQSFADLKEVGAERQVRVIRHMRGSYRIVTADGKGVDLPESDLRFKVDTSALGPFRGKPVILPAGQVGDRASVFFAAPDEISTFIKH